MQDLFFTVTFRIDVIYFVIIIIYIIRSWTADYIVTPDPLTQAIHLHLPRLLYRYMLPNSVVFSSFLWNRVYKISSSGTGCLIYMKYKLKKSSGYIFMEFILEQGKGMDGSAAPPYR